MGEIRLSCTIRTTASGRQAADIAEGGNLFSQPLDLVVLGRDPGDGERLERGELGQGFVPFGDPFPEFGDLGLEPFDLCGPWVDDLAGLER
ncbi:hypothetical protein ACWIID_46245 [Streptomyces phaeochromogenes]